MSTALTHKEVPTRLPGLRYVGEPSPVETVVYGERDLYHWDDAGRLAFEFDVIKESFELHYGNCLTYRRFCASQGVTPATVRSPEDIVRIPLIPTSMFKELTIRSADEKAITKVCRSSGTQGSISCVPRDDVSLERFVGSIRISAEQLLDLHTEAHIFNLGPDGDEAGDVWFPYVMSLLALLRPSGNYVLDGVFYPRALVEDLRALDPQVQPVLVGPPIFFVYLLRFLEEEGMALDLGTHAGFLVTGGGWKAFAGEQVDREVFVTSCMQRLGLPRPAQVRDAYNMVELNTVILECEFGVKHIPPWLVIEALDPGALSPVQPGEMGLLGFWDPLPRGYPGFILSDDFGTTGQGVCRCGRNGRTMDYCRRVAKVEGRGCALTMDRTTRTLNRPQVAAGR
jgi:long-chain-fatty-acid---luciferin-component ligase